ncbi:acid phosphatase [Sphingomonas prati]|uniref:Acid phosphatase n=1 Tax=Sphingomonas prati TaxID=1843237 RepID=A0A7W9BUS8_9SPHN|nr:phosphatase PAP2 family protein [Sphingomonas prati]MBB5730500.1 acid phosphatase (class A) [Sphingomonas prati]GGE94534.1 acid phosphatase [Sphingomonas prati]
MVPIVSLVVLAAAAPVAQPAYLAGARVPDLVRILPAPPAKGSPQAVDDAATFRATRPLLGTERGRIATSDVTANRLVVFSCAAGLRLDDPGLPALARVMARDGDQNMVGRAKDTLAVRRPYLDNDAPIGEPKTAHLAANGDYPSGHTTASWSTALILAELMPDRATAILRRGRQYGESRYICGSHNRSAVEAGYLAGAVQVAALHSVAAFRNDMDAARRQIEARRKSTSAPDPGRCQLEAGMQ